MKKCRFSEYGHLVAHKVLQREKTEKPTFCRFVLIYFGCGPSTLHLIALYFGNTHQSPYRQIISKPIFPIFFKNKHSVGGKLENKENSVLALT